MTIDRAFDEIIEAARGLPRVIDIQGFLRRVVVGLYVIARDMAH